MSVSIIPLLCGMQQLQNSAKILRAYVKIYENTKIFVVSRKGIKIRSTIFPMLKKTAICRLLIEKIVVRGKRLEIHLLVPTDDGKNTKSIEVNLIEQFFDERREFLAGISRTQKNTVGMRNSNDMHLRYEWWVILDSNQ